MFCRGIFEKIQNHGIEIEYTYSINFNNLNLNQHFKKKPIKFI
jgi:uncharacterized protein YkvS